MTIKFNKQINSFIHEMLTKGSYVSIINYNSLFTERFCQYTINIMDD